MATDNPSNFNATGFNRSILRTVEVYGGLMRSKVQLASGDLYREEGVYPRISGGGLPSKITNRFADSPVSEQDYSNRRIRRSDWADGAFMDRRDLDRMVVDPKAAKQSILMEKFRRNEDIIIQQAALGSAQGGDTGETATAFDTNNIIDVTLGASSGFTNAGFTYEKLLRTIRTFGTNNVDIGSKKPCFFIGYEQWEDMMAQDQFINLDYTRAVPIDGGMMVSNYMGCDFVITNILPYMNTAGTGFRIADSDKDTTNGKWTDTDSTDIRSCIALVSDAVLFEIKPDIVTKATERADKSFQWYTYIEQGLGAVRMEEEKVISVPCDQSPAAA